MRKLQMKRNALEIARARAGQTLQPEDELALAKEAEGIKQTQAFQAFNLKVTEINLEYDLLEAKYALMRAEINAAKEAGTLTANQAQRG
jgi:hypothetical protein